MNTDIAIPQSAEVNADEILAEFGIDNIEDTTIVSQTNYGDVIIPNTSANRETSSTPEYLEDFLVEESIPEEVTTSPVVEEETPEQPQDIGLVPFNPNIFEYAENTSRFSGAVWYDKVRDNAITIGGAGGIGSWTALLLARLSPQSITIYDNDIIDTSNLGGQFYDNGQVGMSKVSAISMNVHNFCNYWGLNSINQRITDDSRATHIMIGGFDNMQARKIFFNSWVRYINNIPTEFKSGCLFIDGRLAMDSMQVFCITGDDDYNINRYRNEYLFSDEEAEETICSMKQTSFCANLIASLITNLYVNFCARQIEGTYMELPFKTYYDSNMMFLKTEN